MGSKQTMLYMNRNKVVSIEDGFSSFIGRCECKGLSPQTIKSYKQYWGIFVSFLNTVDVASTDKLTSDLVEQYLQYLKDNYKSNSNSRATNIRTIRVVLYYFIEKSWTESFRVEIPKAEHTVKEVYTEQELKRLLKNLT